jgi:KDO2-lipid IV(A) lauroyltransferase
LRFGLRELRRQVVAALGPAVIDLGYNMVTRREWPSVQRLGRTLGLQGYRVAGRHRRVAVDNIRRALGGELSEERQREIVRDSIVHLVTLFLEAMKYSALPVEEQLRVCAMDGEEHLQAALAQGRGVVTLGGHIGNWELGGLRAMAGGYPVLPLARLPSNPRLAAKFRELREREGYRIIDVAEQGLRSVFRALKDNMVVSILPDRYAKGHGVDVPYFGREVHVWPTPALVARRTESPILPAYTLRQPDGTFRVQIQPPLEMQVTADRDADLVVNTARTMAVLEDQVRAHPEQYVWTYELWRPQLSQPRAVEGATGPAYR